MNNEIVASESTDLDFDVNLDLMGEKIVLKLESFGSSFFVWVCRWDDPRFRVD